MSQVVEANVGKTGRAKQRYEVIHVEMGSSKWSAIGIEKDPRNTGKPFTHRLRAMGVQRLDDNTWQFNAAPTLGRFRHRRRLSGAQRFRPARPHRRRWFSLVLSGDSLTLQTSPTNISLLIELQAAVANTFACQFPVLAQGASSFPISSGFPRVIPMFLNVHEFAFTQLLEQNWQTILAEYEALPAHKLVHWPERSIYDFGWRAYALVALGETLAPNAQACPNTMRLLQSIPGLVNAGFSLFAAGTHVHPHVGYTSSVLRFHLGLRIPDRCGLRVQDEVRSWEEGRLLAFDDMVEHSAWNESEENRAILLFDVLRPGAKLEITPSAAKAIEDYLESLRVSP